MQDSYPDELNPFVLTILATYKVYGTMSGVLL